MRIWANCLCLVMITYNLKPFNRDSDSGWLKLGEAIECPKCLGKGKGCMISTDQDRAVCTRDSSKTPFSSSSKFPSWIHILKETDKKEYKLEVKDEDEDVPEATDAQKDVAYKRLKAKYPLNDADKEYLKSFKNLQISEISSKVALTFDMALLILSTA